MRSYGPALDAHTSGCRAYTLWEVCLSDRGVYRGIYSSLLDDPDFQRLSASARLTLLTLRLCRDTGPAAIFRYYPEVIMCQTGLSGAALTKALEELSQAVWIAIEEPVVWVRNGLRYDPMMKPETNELHRKSIERHVNGLPKRQIVLNFCDYYKIAKPFDRVSIGSRVPLPSEDDSEKDSDPEKDAERRRVSAPAGKGDGEFLDDLRKNPAYQGVDVDREAGKCQTWCETNSKVYGRRRLVNWLNRVERPMAQNGANGSVGRRYSNDQWAGRPGGVVKL